jgi:hypothetical protein
MLYAIAIDIIWYNAYGYNDPRPKLDQFKKANINKTESWCRLALSFTTDYAEPYVLLGDVYWHRGELDAAMKMYLTATKKTVGVGKFQTVPMYNEVPYDRLACVFEAKRMPEMALHWNKKAITMSNLIDYKQRRQNLIKILNEEFTNELSADKAA